MFALKFFYKIVALTTENYPSGNLSYFAQSVGFRAFVFRSFGFETSDDLINQTQITNPKNAP